jgi:hypothetical protein
MKNKYMLDDVCTTTNECCPHCGIEIEISILNLEDCPHCGHKEVLPCSMCVFANDAPQNCDWNKETRCTPFRKENKND